MVSLNHMCLSHSLLGVCKERHYNIWLEGVQVDCTCEGECTLSVDGVSGRYLQDI